MKAVFSSNFFLGKVNLSMKLDSIKGNSKMGRKKVKVSFSIEQEKNFKGIMIKILKMGLEK